MNAVHLIHDVAEKTGIDEDVVEKVLDALIFFGVIDTGEVEEYEADANEAMVNDDDYDVFDDDDVADEQHGGDEYDDDDRRGW